MNSNYYEGQSFQGLRLQEETFTGLQFVDCNFTHCSLDSCTLRHCDFSGCVFLRCRVSALKAETVQMKFGEFEECVLTGVNWSLLQPAGRFSEPISRMERCRLKYNSFSNLNLARFDFSGSELVETIFAECKLSESSFQGCGLQNTEFFKCDLRKADFREAVGYRIDVLNNEVKNARFSLPEAMRLLGPLGIQLE